MEHTLILRFTGPLQSWGVQSRFTIRDSIAEPSKSGVIGLLCAALGRSRTDSIADLAALRLGVRVERDGHLRNDYHTVQNVLSADADLTRFEKGLDAKQKDLQTVLTQRAYLHDAWFTVGLEGDEGLLREMEQKLRHPCWMLTMGRRSCPPGLPLVVPDGLQTGVLTEILPGFEDPWWGHIKCAPLRSRRLVLEQREGESAPDLRSWRAVAHPVRPDQPLSFSPRRFAPRRVAVYVPVLESA